MVAVLFSTPKAMAGPASRLGCDYISLCDANGNDLNEVTAAATSNSDNFIITPRLTLGFWVEWGVESATGR